MANMPKQRSLSSIHNMEDAIDSFALARLTDLLIQEAKFLHGVTGEVEEIQTELRRLQSFLKVVDARQDEDKAVISNFIADIREAAYDAEDVIETFAFRVAQRRRTGFLNILKRYACIFSELIALHKVGTEIEAIKQRISTTTASLERYGNVNKTKGQERSSSRIERQSRLNDEETVGVEDSVKILVEQLVKPDKRCSVVSIWGMGGLGKTTLARKVYHHVDVRRHFDCYAWCSISQHCNIRGVVEGLLIKLTSPDEEQRKKIEKMRDEQLFKRAYEIQKEKKCLVILDDVWRIEDWKCLRPAFPLLKEGSKILLTTRIQAVALQVDPQHHFLYQPKLLSEEESWKLLQRKAFPSYKAIDPIISKEMEDLGKKMAKRCDGLPFAILVLGGLLATKPTFSEWKMVETNIRSYLSRGDDHSKKQCSGVSHVLDLSYQDLPYHLKLCFIYLVHFPEDHEIPVNILVQMWMAEGIIAGLPDNEETLEDVGQWYLDELIGRCMVQVGATSSNGMVKTCRLHDLMRDLGMSKARENFFEIFPPQVETNPFSTSNKVRRGVIYLDAGAKTLSSIQVPDNARNLRSLLTFCYAPNAVHMMPRKLDLIKDLKDFKLLRVLHLERLLLDEKLVRAIRYLIHLRYLSFKNARLSCIHSSIGNLGSMQTLDLRFDNLVIGFKMHVLSKMKWLRHLYLPRFITTDDKVLWDSLSHLETLKNFDAERWAVQDLATLTKLRKLKMMKVKSFQELEVILKDSNGLHSLSFEGAIKSKIVEKDLMKLSTCQHLYKLKLPGQISSLAGLQHLPQSLTKLVLRSSQLAQDPMPILERLPNLTVLHLMVNAYVGEEMVFSANGFPKLKNLVLSLILNLKKLRVNKDAMPRLQGLKIACCLHLEMIPEGLRYITTLAVLEIQDMPIEFTQRLRVINGNKGEDFYKVQHVPSISFFP